VGLIDVLTRAVGSRAHVLVAEVPGAFRPRVALERALDHMGWCLAESVADADVLAVVGDPGDAFAAVIEHVWAQMSEPRVRIHLREEMEVQVRLSEACEQLRDGARRLTGQDVRRSFTPSAEAMAHDDDGDHDSDGDGDGDHEGHAGHSEHGDEHGDHGGGDGNDHSAMMPDGIALAEGAEDRDGLEMDELHLPLGPVLAHWPAGVVLRVTLHGDVVSDAEVEQLPAEPGATLTGDDRATRAARLLDAAGSVLTLAGLPAVSARARRLRDRCLDGDLVDGLEVAALGERVGRQRVLRWSMSGLTVTGSHGGSERLHDRLTELFERARAELDGEAMSRVGPGAQALPELVRGQELAAVRLWLAAMMADLAERELSEAADG